MKKKLNYEQMVKDIIKIASLEYTAELEERANFPRKKPFTQKESKQMANELVDIWFIAHCLTCGECQKKYIIDN